MIFIMQKTFMMKITTMMMMIITLQNKERTYQGAKAWVLWQSLHQGWQATLGASKPDDGWYDDDYDDGDDDDDDEDDNDDDDDDDADDDNDDDSIHYLIVWGWSLCF